MEFWQREKRFSRLRQWRRTRWRSGASATAEFPPIRTSRKKWSRQFGSLSTTPTRWKPWARQRKPRRPIMIESKNLKNLCKSSTAWRPGSQFRRHGKRDDDGWILGGKDGFRNGRSVIHRLDADGPADRAGREEGAHRR